MRTRSSLEYTIPRRRNRRRSRQQQEAIPIVDKFPIQMADDRPMAEQLQAPTGGFESAIVVPPINAQNFELKSSLINLVQNRIFRGGNDEEPHAHIRHFESITNNQRYPDVPNTTIKLLLFPFSLDGELLRKCPHHGFSLMHQLDTFYNSLSYNDQDSLNSAAGGNFLYKSPTEGLQIIENKAKVRCSRNAVMRVSTNAPPSSSSSNFEFQQMAAALEDKMTLTFRNEMNEMKYDESILMPTPGFDLKRWRKAAAVGGFVQGNSGYPPSSVASYTRPPGFTQPNPQASRPNQGYNGNQGGVVLDGPLPPMPPPYVNPDNEKAKETKIREREYMKKEKDDEVRDSVFEEILIDKEEFFLPKSPPIKPNKPTKTLPYPSRVEYEKKGENDKVQIQKFWEMFKKIHVNITLADALILSASVTKM
ncbi:hypothetical protein Tco_1361893 [Tanacetum coccineum]